MEAFGPELGFEDIAVDLLEVFGNEMQYAAELPANGINTIQAPAIRAYDARSAMLNEVGKIIGGPSLSIIDS